MFTIIIIFLEYFTCTEEPASCDSQTLTKINNERKNITLKVALNKKGKRKKSPCVLSEYEFDLLIHPSSSSDVFEIKGQKNEKTCNPVDKICLDDNPLYNKKEVCLDIKIRERTKFVNKYKNFHKEKKHSKFLKSFRNLRRVVSEWSIYTKNLQTNIKIVKKLVLQKDLHPLKRKFKMIGLLGSGSYSKVSLYMTNDTGVCTAIKHTIARNPYFSGMNEYDVCKKLMSLNHINIIRIFDIVNMDNETLIFMEFKPGQSLKNFVEHNNEIDEDLKRKIIKQCFNGIEFLHNHDIVHGDISTKNILVLCDYIVKIINFGFSRFLKYGEEVRIEKSLSSFASPERITGRYLHSDDLWSMAICIHYIYERSFPFTKTDLKIYVSKRGPLVYNPGICTPIDMVDLIGKMLNIKLIHRLGTSQGDIKIIKKHKCFCKSKLKRYISIFVRHKN
ncbi:Serine/threonine-protein kinase [Spraguea lophii 42_110]|uniref:non-specific serine/threonine protein kinase n=1 Tax=Spraguea lophii (strain 42_110) TaxID=1358809 RepID=S7W967_SPRLO|nr:Serine/threonine-protein kinase [Spraguea lophii 42_110]